MASHRETRSQKRRRLLELPSSDSSSAPITPSEQIASSDETSPSAPTVPSEPTADISPSSSSSSSVRFGRLQIAISNFRTLFEGSTYVDKTNFIAEFLDSVGRVQLLLRPRRSGKSTLLSMIKFFIELNRETEDERWTILNDPTRPRPAIMNAQYENLRDHFAAHPVLFLDFSTVSSGSTWIDTLVSFVVCFRKEVTRLNELGYLKVDSPAWANASYILKNIKTYSPCVRDGAKISDIPRELVTILGQTTGKKVVVLVDEYELPLYTAKDNDVFTETENFARRMYSGLLKNNDYFFGGLLVGVLRVAKAGLLSGVNSIEEHPLHSTSPRFATSCMFTENQVLSMFNHYSTRDDFQLEWAQLKKWYKGYTCVVRDTPLWNPWSVMKALDGNKIGSFWTETGIDDVIVHLLRASERCQEELAMLFSGGTRMIIYEQNLRYSSLQPGSQTPLQNAVANFFGLLLYSGYLTIDTAENIDVSEPEDANGLIRRPLRIPNEEVRRAFKRWIQDDVLVTLSTRREVMTTMFTAMCDGNKQDLLDAIDELIAPVSYFTLGPSESTYSAFLFALIYFAINPQGWEVRQQLEGGSGRCDIIMWETAGTKGIVLELKTVKAKRGLEQAAKDGLAQIKNRNYARTFSANIRKAWLFGIAFCVKECRIEVEEYRSTSVL